MESFNKSDVKLVSASEVDKTLLTKYYQNTFPHRRNSLPLIWKWLNNTTFYKNEIPFVLKYNNEIIGHTGLRPVTLKIDEKNYLSGWPIDLRVDSRFQNCGLGKQLTNKLVDYAEIHLAFPNKNSYPLFKKLGWKDGGKTYTHFFPIQPLDHPRFYRKVPSQLRYILNSLTKPYFKFKYKKYGNYEFQIEEITDNIIKEFETQRNLSDLEYIINKNILPLRDMDYLKWRILESPNSTKYKLFSVNDIKAIISMNNNRGKYIDILSISSYINLDQVLYLIGRVCLYATNNNYAYIRICSSNEPLSRMIQKKLGRGRKEYNLCFYTNNKELEAQILSYKWFWELIDSDFEYMEFNHAN